MAENPFYVPPPNILQALIAGGQAYQQGQDRQRDERNELSKLLMLKEDRAFRQQESQRAQSNSDRSFKLQQDVATRREEPEDIRKLRASGIDPSSPEGKAALFPRTGAQLTAGDKKAIMDAEDEIPGVRGTIENLGRALELNGKTFQGMGAGTRATIGANLPDALVPDWLADKKTAVTTQEWQKIMGPEALQAMASTLKGATTDFELRKFIEMLGDPATDPSVRAGVIKRMQTLAQRKLDLSESRVKELRGGTYYKSDRPAQGGGSDTLAAARSALAKGAPRDAVIQRLRDNGIDPSGL